MGERVAKGVEVLVGGKWLSIETGKMARQADGATIIRYGDTMVLVSAVMAPDRVERDFLPLTVDYREKTYAAGKIPGGFFKKEGRPQDREVLTSRLIDRSIRPLFPKGLRNELQVIAIVLSADPENDSDVLALTGAGAALEISGIPFGGPIAGVRVGKVDGELIANPTHTQMQTSTINLVVAGTMDGVVMVEAGAQEVPEKEMLEALEFGHGVIKEIVPKLTELKEMVGKRPREVEILKPSDAFVEMVREKGMEKISMTLDVTTKEERSRLFDEAVDAAEALLDEEEWVEDLPFLKDILKELQSQLMRGMVLREGKRIDARRLKEIRDLYSEVGILPRAHGSGLFCRGETQALVTSTLGTQDDEQRLDELKGESTKRFMLHYYFPPFCVGEVRRISGQGRREIGHGALAERALEPVLPKWERFPYTIRIVSDILESNGSSSMATVCGATLALMDAGAPIKAPVAGIAMGLIQEGEQVSILTDILGAEDHLGDMDFKVAGTPRGVTALQMDIKTTNVSTALMYGALEQAREALQQIFDKMLETIPRPRKEPSIHAPRVYITQVKPDDIGLIIGPGGKQIRKIEALGVDVNVEDSGEVTIYSTDSEAADQALEVIRSLTQEVKVGEVFKGKVKKVTSFGAFVGLTSRLDGLVHISQLAEGRVRRVEDVVREGDTVTVRVIRVDDDGKVSLTMKDVKEGGSSGDEGRRDRRGDR